LNLKKTLKAIKINESTISMVLGAIIIVAVGLLVINYFRKTDTGETLPISETQTQTETEPTIGETHVVKSGETLWSIAEAAYGSGYNWVDIAKANNLSNPGLIETGQSLEIPDVSAKTPTKTASILNPSSVDPITGSSYTVVHGDYLWDIAVRAYGDGYKWVEIAHENNLENPNIIHSGNVLTIPR